MNRAGIRIALLAFLVSIASSGTVAAADDAEDSSGRVPFVTTQAMKHLAGLATAIDSQASSDTIGPSRVVGIIEAAWIEGFRSGVNDSTVVSPSPIESLIGSQIVDIDSLLARAKPARSIGESDRTGPGPDEILAAIHNLAALESTFSFQRELSRTVLLVVSSVSCECERKRCEKMLALRSSIATAHPALPIAVVDIVHMPAVARILSITTIPSWVLFSAKGEVASIITGFEEPDDARATIYAWLGAMPAVPK
jgi:hypothetical protein